MALRRREVNAGIGGVYSPNSLERDFLSPAVNRKVVGSIPVSGAKRIQCELLRLLVNCGAADMFAKWRIFAERAPSRK